MPVFVLPFLFRTSLKMQIHPKNRSPSHPPPKKQQNEMKLWRNNFTIRNNADLIWRIRLTGNNFLWFLRGKHQVAGSASSRYNDLPQGCPSPPKQRTLRLICACHQISMSIWENDLVLCFLLGLRKCFLVSFVFFLGEDLQCLETVSL